MQFSILPSCDIIYCRFLIWMTQCHWINRNLSNKIRSKRAILRRIKKGFSYYTSVLSNLEKRYFSKLYSFSFPSSYICFNFQSMGKLSDSLVLRLTWWFPPAVGYPPGIWLGPDLSSPSAVCAGCCSRRGEGASWQWRRWRESFGTLRAAHEWNRWRPLWSYCWEWSCLRKNEVCCYTI